MKDFDEENKTREELEKKEQASQEMNYEENDGWKFEATAMTLENNVIGDSEMEIDIPKEKPAPVKKQTVNTSAPKAKKKSGNTGKFIATAVITAVIIGVLVWLGIGYYTTPNTDEKMNPGNVAMTVGDTDVSIGMYNYYYTCIFQNYVQYAQYGYYNMDTSIDFAKQTTTDANGKTTTWANVFVNDTIDQIKYITAYYEEAVKNGVKLTSDQKESIKTQLDSLKETAADSDVSVDEYISETYGDYCGYATLKKMLTQCYIAENYFQQRNVENKATEKEINAYYDKHSDEYTQVPFAYIQIAFNPEESGAKEKAEKSAKEYAEGIKSVDDMKEVLPKACKDTIKEYVNAGYFENAEEAEKTLTENIETTITKSDESFTKEGIEWLFSENTKVGSCASFTDENNSLIFIVLKTGNAKVSDDVVYSVRHILIMPESEKEEESDTEETKYTDEEWAAAKKKADDIVAQFNKGDRSEYSFALLAEKYSDDTESTSNGSSGYFGGLYGGTELGVMVKDFENWSIDDSRKYGDVDIVKSDFGYHIMYFVEKTKNYLYNCEKAVVTEKENKFVDSMEVVKHKGAMAKTKVAQPMASSTQNADSEGLAVDDSAVESSE